MRKCSDCQQYKEDSNFQILRVHGVVKSQRTFCGQCAYKRYKVSKVRADKKSRSKAREIRNSAKSRPCMDCGIQYKPWQMQFDHRENKRFDISSSTSSASIKNMLIEISKCDVVCANCHADRTYKKRQFLHSKNQSVLYKEAV